jgi:hypothetical protein
MAKITVPSTNSGYNLSVINTALQDITTELNTKVLYRDNPLGEPNAMSQLLDMNGNSIINAGNISASSVAINGVAIEPGEAVSAATQQIFEFTSAEGQSSFNISPLTPASSSVIMEVDGFVIPPSSLSIAGSLLGFPELSEGREVVLRVFTRDVGSSPTAAEIIITFPGGVSRTVTSKSGDFKTLEDFGGSDGGVVDNLAAFNAAIANGVKVLYAPGEVYYFSAGITIPDGVAVYGGGCMPSNVPRGTRFTFALATDVCVTLCGPAASNGNAILRGVSIVRAAGTIPTGSIGVKAQNFYAISLSEVGSFRHARPFVFKGDGATLGITAMCDRLYTGAASDAHVEIDSTPEIRFSQCRFGQNGSGDLNCTAFLRIKGGSTTNAAGGVNTIVVENSQFNQGANVAASWIEFVDQVPGNIGDVTLFQFDTVYVETVSAGITSDASWATIARLQANNLTFNSPAGVPFLSLNAATRVDNWQIDNSAIYGALTLASTPQVNFFHVSNTQFGGAVSLTGPTSGSVASLSDCNFAGGLTLAGQWASLKVNGGSISTGSLVNSATGGVDIDIYPYNALTVFTPVLRFGGASTGITYSVQSGAYQIQGKLVNVQLRLVLTSKGSATGIADITMIGLPPVTTAAYSLGNGSGGVYALNMSGLTSPIVGVVGIGPLINLFDYGATGIVSTDATNFTNTSEIALRVSYMTA